MKWLALLLPLLVACNEVEQPKPPHDWVVKAAQTWAEGLGETDPKASCNGWFQGNGATCAVKLNNTFYKVYCYWPKQTCELAGGR